MDQYIALYMRVSSPSQDTASQEPDLKRWVNAFAGGSSVEWFRETKTGKTMERPVWDALQREMAYGNVSKLVVWRLDRLGRTASGLTRLFEWLNTSSVGEGWSRLIDACWAFNGQCAGLGGSLRNGDPSRTSSRRPGGGTCQRQNVGRQRKRASGQSTARANFNHTQVACRGHANSRNREGRWTDSPDHLLGATS